MLDIAKNSSKFWAHLTPGLDSSLPISASCGRTEPSPLTTSWKSPSYMLFPSEESLHRHFGGCSHHQICTGLDHFSYVVNHISGRSCCQVPPSSLKFLCSLFPHVSIHISNPFSIVGTHFPPFCVSHISIYMATLREVLSPLLTTPTFWYSKLKLILLN